MGRYVSFDASLKIHMSGKTTSTKTAKSHSGGLYGYIHHIARDVDRQNGCEVSHSNPDINPDLTVLNESYFKNNLGEWEQAEKSSEMVQSINRRIDYAKKHKARIYNGGKNDTVIVRSLVVQLDSDTITQHKDTWVFDTIKILEDMLGADNITCFSIHRDETSVAHVHVAFVPVHEYEDTDGNRKCSVSQTKFFTSPKSLSIMHRKIRTALNEIGYDVEMENKPIEKTLLTYYDKNGVSHQKGLTPEQLKQLTQRKDFLEREAKKMQLEKTELEVLAKAMKEVQASAKQTQENLEENLRIFECQQADFQNEKANLQTQMQAVIDEKRKVAKMQSDADGMLQKAYAVSDICQKILVHENTLNKHFLDFLERESRRTKKPIRRAVENLYKRFNEEHKTERTALGDELDAIRRENKRQRILESLNNSISPNDSNDTPEFNFF